MNQTLLEREEYIEQAYFFRALGQRLRQNLSTQDVLHALQEEILSTTRLPMAISFLEAELKLHGVIAPAMAKLAHYFTPFQTYLIAEAERERGRFDFQIALEVLEREAEYRATSPPAQGVFLFQFETLCRNRLGYDHGLEAVAGDPYYNDDWREFILSLRRQIGLVDVADLVYVRSQHYTETRRRQGLDETPALPPLFGVKEGRIALAHRRKEPLLLFATLERQLGYPVVPRPRPPDESATILPGLVRRVERIEQRLKLLEEEQKGGIDLSKFYSGREPPGALDQTPDAPPDAAQPD